jgi:hypothetical protein
MKIANVVYEELVNHIESDYINYINKSVNYNEIDNTLPTLYVGWRFMKSCNNNEKIMDADILTKCIIPNKLYWEFSFNEYKSLNIIGVYSFVAKAPDLYFRSRYNYVNIDPTFLNIRTSIDFLDVLPKSIDRIYKYKNECIYLLHDNEIIGINLRLIKFLNFDQEIFFKELSSRCPNYIDDLNGDEYMKYYKIYDRFESLKRFVVTMIAK